MKKYFHFLIILGAFFISMASASAETLNCQYVNYNPIDIKTTFTSGIPYTSTEHLLRFDVSFDIAADGSIKEIVKTNNWEGFVGKGSTVSGTSFVMSTNNENLTANEITKMISELKLGLYWDRLSNAAFSYAKGDFTVNEDNFYSGQTLKDLYKTKKCPDYAIMFNDATGKYGAILAKNGGQYTGDASTMLNSDRRAAESDMFKEGNWFIAPLYKDADGSIKKMSTYYQTHINYYQNMLTNLIKEYERERCYNGTTNANSTSCNVYDRLMNLSTFTNNLYVRKYTKTDTFLVDETEESYSKVAAMLGCSSADDECIPTKVDFTSKNETYSNLIEAKAAVTAAEVEKAAVCEPYLSSCDAVKANARMHLECLEDQQTTCENENTAVFDRLNDARENLSDIESSLVSARNTFSTGFNIDTTSDLKCSDIENTLKVIQDLMKVISLAIPILLVILISVDLTKAVASGDDDTMKKTFKAIKTRLMAAILFFFIPLIVTILINLAVGSGFTESLTSGIKCL